MSAVLAVARILITDDTTGERVSHLVVAPIWLAFAVYFVILRRTRLRGRK